MFRNGNFIRTILGIALLVPALYLIVWCILNPELVEGSYGIITIVLIMLSIILLYSTYRDAKRTKAEEENPDNTLEKTPEEIAKEKGVDLNRIPYKSKALAVVLCLFGVFGLHRIYLGHVKSGLIMLACSVFLGWLVFPLCFLLAFAVVDLISIVKGTLKDSYNRPLV